MNIKKNILLYILILMCCFSIYQLFMSGYYLITNIYLNGNYIIPLLSVIISFIILFFSYYTLNKLFINSTKNIKNKNLYGIIKEVKNEKNFPFIITVLDVETMTGKKETILFKSLLIDFYSKLFKKEQKIYCDEKKTLFSTYPIDPNEVLNISKLFKDKSFLNTILVKGEKI